MELYRLMEYPGSRLIPGQDDSELVSLTRQNK